MPPDSPRIRDINEWLRSKCLAIEFKYSPFAGDPHLSFLGFTVIDPCLILHFQHDSFLL